MKKLIKKAFNVTKIAVGSILIFGAGMAFFNYVLEWNIALSTILSGVVLFKSVDFNHIKV